MLDKVVSRVLHFEPQSDVMPQHITVIHKALMKKISLSSIALYSGRLHHSLDIDLIITTC